MDNLALERFCIRWDGIICQRMSPYITVSCCQQKHVADKTKRGRELLCTDTCFVTLLLEWSLANLMDYESLQTILTPFLKKKLIYHPTEFWLSVWRDCHDLSHCVLPLHVVMVTYAAYASRLMRSSVKWWYCLWTVWGKQIQHLVKEINFHFI